MRALVNAPDTEDGIALQDVPEPVPGPHEALIAVSAFSLNRGELTLLRTRPAGWRPGQDVTGTVLQAAADGSGPPTGSRVVGVLDGAGWAERATAPVSRLAVLPDAVSFEQAAALPVAGITALRTVRLGGAIVGRRVLVTGASGGVGNLAVQIAAHAGAEVVAVAGPAHATALRALGAADVVARTDQANGAYWLVLEFAGGASLAAALGLLEPRGTLVVFGNSANQPTPLSFGDFRSAQNARIQSFFSFTSEAEDRFAPDLAILADMVAQGWLRPEIGMVLGWDRIAEGLGVLRERRVRGKVVFRTD